MRQRALSLFLASQSGVAAAEMALVTPLLLALMTGTFEIGNYFYSEHVVATAVRDGARYASRRSFSDFPCGGSITAAVVTNTQNITTTGAISGGVQRLAGWTNPTTSVSVTFACDTTNASAGNGIYTGQTGGVRVVTVAATVPYTPLFYRVGLSNANTLNLVAQSQAAVVGI
jgi:Flp pilus assembly protein TadG